MVYRLANVRRSSRFQRLIGQPQLGKSRPVSGPWVLLLLEDDMGLVCKYCLQL